MSLHFYVTSEEIPGDKEENMKENEGSEVSSEDQVIAEDNSNDFLEDEPKGYELPR